jgi:hypothetical protein
VKERPPGRFTVGEADDGEAGSPQEPQKRLPGGSGFEQFGQVPRAGMPQSLT